MNNKEIQALKDQLYKDSKLLDTLFNNISFNLHECTDDQIEKNDIAKARRIIEKDMVSNMLKIAQIDSVNEQKTDLLDIGVKQAAQDKANLEFLETDLLTEDTAGGKSSKSK